MPPKAEPESQARRQLKIKVGSVTRLRKEIVMYEKELEAQRAKVAKMREDGAEAASIKQQARAALRLRSRAAQARRPAASA